MHWLITVIQRLGKIRSPKRIPVLRVATTRYTEKLPEQVNEFSANASKFLYRRSNSIIIWKVKEKIWNFYLQLSTLIKGARKKFVHVEFCMKKDRRLFTLTVLYHVYIACMKKRFCQQIYSPIKKEKKEETWHFLLVSLASMSSNQGWNFDIFKLKHFDRFQSEFRSLHITPGGQLHATVTETCNVSA